MPGMDGIEALRYLARQNTTAGILLASGMDQRVLASARQLGDSLGLKMLGTLQKPAMLDDIEMLLAKHIEPGARISVEELRQAIDEHELLVHYQPKVVRAANDWHVRSAEALVRWRHPRLGLLYPGEFLPLAEQSGLIVDVTDFVLTDAIRQIGHWRQRGLDLAAAVNLSPRLVQDLEFPDRLTRIFREFEVTPEQLTLEVTEAASLDDPELVMDIFTRLRVKGVGLSLDDFGTGTSSLTQLYKMPFSEVKIDGSLICDVANSKARRHGRARDHRAGAQPVAVGLRRGSGDLAGVRVPRAGRLRCAAGRLHCAGHARIRDRGIHQRVERRRSDARAGRQEVIPAKYYRALRRAQIARRILSFGGRSRCMGADSTMRVPLPGSSKLIVPPSMRARYSMIFRPSPGLRCARPADSPMPSSAMIAEACAR